MKGTQRFEVPGANTGAAAAQELAGCRELCSVPRTPYCCWQQGKHGNQINVLIVEDKGWFLRCSADRSVWQNPSAAEESRHPLCGPPVTGMFSLSASPDSGRG